MHVGHPAACQLCERTIDPGHTCYSILADDRGTAGCPDYQPASLYRTCWECGEAIGQHLGFADADGLPLNPPFGGGVNAPPPPALPDSRMTAQTHIPRESTPNDTEIHRLQSPG